MTATAVNGLTLYPMQDIGCERGSDWLPVDFGHPMKNKMAVITGWLSYVQAFYAFFSTDFITIVFNPDISRTLAKIS